MPVTVLEWLFQHSPTKKKLSSVLPTLGTIFRLRTGRLLYHYSEQTASLIS